MNRLRSFFTVYSNILYYVFYGLSWMFWQAGGKQVRRAFMKSYDWIDLIDAQRAVTEELDERQATIDASEFDFEHPKEVRLTPDVWINPQTNEWWFKFLEEVGKTYGPFPSEGAANIHVQHEINARKYAREPK